MKKRRLRKGFSRLRFSSNEAIQVDKSWTENFQLFDLLNIHESIFSGVEEGKTYLIALMELPYQASLDPSLAADYDEKVFNFWFLSFSVDSKD